MIKGSLSFTTQAPFNEKVVLKEIFAATENAPRSTSQLCTTHIDKLWRSGNLSATARFLKSSHDKHIVISSNTYNVVLAAASEKNDIGLISQVFIYAIGSFVSLPSTSYLFIAKAFAKTNDCTQLLRFIEDVSGS
ncbi:hypothetical protein TorRG33x02_062540 [Trema orientale]|uniref:Pentatricopeptide repeat n=1 Tax=Trema orientale TaxID=63057 RepID=A0A2P5FJH8_TREOI|nr:hypothetical protein TorRG33x02_062540 [Trema orientale]